MKKTILVFGTISGVVISTFMGISMAVMSCGSSDEDGGTGSMIIGFAAMAHNPFFFAMYTYMEILPVGIIITLISALVLKKKLPINNML